MAQLKDAQDYLKLRDSMRQNLRRLDSPSTDSVG
jgi:hypothetical protein